MPGAAMSQDLDRGCRSPQQVAVQDHRALFLSDLHLGARGCRVDQLGRFLATHSAGVIYLVGDILDLWHPRRPHWTKAHDSILGLLLARAEAGVRVVYLTGNHDTALHALAQHFAGRIEVRESVVHHAGDGRAYLVLHGDCIDSRVLRSHVATRIGSRADNGLRALDGWLRRLRREARDEGERSAIGALLSWVNTLLSMGRGYERRLVRLARSGGHDGVICGHFHKPALHDDHGPIYANCGDWMDSCTAIAEAEDGSLRLLCWEDAAQGAPVSMGEADWVQP